MTKTAKIAASTIQSVVSKPVGPYVCASIPITPDKGPERPVPVPGPQDPGRAGGKDPVDESGPRAARRPSASRGATPAAYAKAGFVEEGRLRPHALVEGRRRDELVMSVLREDWTPPTDAP
jgi:hypothetical protein